ncbi:hypothetical protein FKG94_17050 [Exilibacterium tricleocarpae]|uniref:Uncharacterized protein n=1 Tax=Exilibacterium tricleocarpae TaxID=2591008 RepID=A0A545T877_9GAMM|nr:hypothetical protein [Exilibacterium tricleocarpae]TQV73411.1 hypothetical protein FKG94_17050 [Exilibacterium tricleocarpae]
MTDKYKAVALRLHALSAADRHWCLAQLSETQKDRLAPLLDELDLLGIPKVALTTAELTRLQAPGSAADNSGNGGDRSVAEQTIAAVEAPAVEELLNGEPDVLVAALLAGGDWPWETVLLEGLPPARRRRVAEYRQQRSAAISPRLQAALLEGFAERLSARSRQVAAERRQRDSDPALARPGFFRRLMWQR